MVGDGSSHSEPGQVGQQEQGGQLVDRVPDQRRAHDQPVEQQQVKQGLSRGRTDRKAALRTGPSNFLQHPGPHEPSSWGSVHSPGAQRSLPTCYLPAPD